MHRPIARRRLLQGVLGITGTTLLGCRSGGGPGSAYPQPEVYEDPSDFSGPWRGEVEGVSGKLRIDQLGGGRYYANFRGADRPVRYILSLNQTRADMGGGALALANVCEFTWQDGRGAVGAGWLLINRENSTLTGTFGRGGSMSGMGVWTFVRGGRGRARAR
ncbi:MAG: hypothetical protein AAGA54_16575 [Myxococcota bacterium]